MSRDSIQRFSARADDYVRYRPGYPSAVLQILKSEAGLTTESIVADIGSGTGISARLFLDAGHTVLGVEPNDEMRRAAEAKLKEFAEFHCVKGTAEATTLADHSVDLIVAAQAFHWFDPVAARKEFLRIIRSQGSIALMWNSRRTDSTPFLRDYEALLQRYGTDYQQIHQRWADPKAMRIFFDKNKIQQRSIYNEQRFDFEGLCGRLLSSSYVPTANDPNYQAMLEELRLIFDDHADSGQVRVEYDTEVFLGRPD